MPDRVRSTPRGGRLFPIVLALLGGSYVALVLAMLIAEASHTSWGVLRRVVASPEIAYAIRLTLISCTLTAIACLWVATPLAYLLSRWDDATGSRRRRWLVRGVRAAIDTIVDIPIVLPPLAVGLCLLVLFQSAPLRAVEERIAITYAVPSVIIAQFTVSCAFAVRTLRVTFDQINPRTEQVARTLGCTRAQAFWRVTLPEARTGLLAAATVAWARALGEFGPILVFAGVTRLRTEVLSTSVYLYLNTGELPEAIAVSLLMVSAAVGAALVLRLCGAGRVRREGRAA